MYPRIHSPYADKLFGGTVQGRMQDFGEGQCFFDASRHVCVDQFGDASRHVGVNKYG